MNSNGFKVVDTPDYFIFHGEKYLIHSVVKIKKEYVRKFFLEYDYTQIDKVHVTANGTHVYFLSKPYNHFGECGVTYTNTFENPDEFIEEIVMPAKYEKVKPEYYGDTEVDGVISGWIIYIVVMVVGTIFYDRILIWLFASLVFFPWRSKKLKK